MATQPVQLAKPIDEPIQPVKKRVRRPHPLIIRAWRLTTAFAFNVIPFAIAAIFLWLQIQIGKQTGPEWLNKVELCTSIVVEFVLVFVWSLFIKND